ncbi:hypothetical protein [Telmatospirillum siberiense]|uniref:hypothetical protein n=1 Tax=Telmatospirillum siberiense TaxID=382514 RepID=UPI0011AFC455
MCKRLESEFAAWDGVTSATGNPVTGSLLVIYDAARIVPAEMEARVAAAAAPACGRGAGGEDGGRPPRPVLSAGSLLRRLNRPAKIGMLGSLSLSLAALAMNKRLHAAAGGLYLAFLVLHLARHRESLTK